MGNKWREDTTVNRIMVWVNIALLIITGTLAYFNYKLVSQSVNQTAIFQQQVSISKAALKSDSINSTDANKATIRSLQISDSSLKLTRSIADTSKKYTQYEIRAFITIAEIEPLSINITNNNLVTLILKNEGKSPAYDSHIQTYIIACTPERFSKYLDSTKNVMNNISYMKSIPFLTIGSGGTQGNSTPFTLDNMGIDNFKNENWNIYYWGNIIYTDIFHASHFTHFCAQYDITKRAFINDGRYNDAN